MDDKAGLTRREFMKLAAAGTGSLTLLAGCAGPKESRWVFLTEDDALLLGSIADQIVPLDEWPGGREAGVVTFIDRQLAGPYSRFQADYRKGLDAVTGTCIKIHGKRFENLPWEQQLSFLKDMEAGKLAGDAWKDGFCSRFFELLRNHSMQGFFGSPRHGGNRNYVSYKMMGLDYPQIVGQNRYRS